MPIEDAIKGTVERLGQLRRQLEIKDNQLSSLAAERVSLQAEFDKLNAGIDALAAALNVPIEKEPKKEEAVLELAAEAELSVKET